MAINILMTTNTESFAVTHSHGVTEIFASYDQALAAVGAVYSDASIGHSGDIADGGGRTLVWVDEDTARDDDGSRACCVISRRS